MIKLQVPSITERECTAVSNVLRSGWLAQGSKVKEFEHALADYIGVPYVVCCSSCTAAIHMTLHILRQRTKKNVILTSDYCYPSVGIAIRQAGFKPIFLDINDHLNTSLMNTEFHLKENKGKVFAVLTTTQFGYPNDYDAWEELCEKYDVMFLEDAAPAIGSRYKGAPVGRRPFASFFSFYPTKILTTGEGGAIATNSRELANNLEVYRNHGRSGGQFHVQGFPYRMTDVHAAIGIEQLKSLQARIILRREIASKYETRLDESITTIPLHPKPFYWNVQRYPIRTSIKGKELVKSLAKCNIQAVVGTYSQTAQPIFDDFTPIETKLAVKYVVTIPMHVFLTSEDIVHITNTTNMLVRKPMSGRKQ